MTGDEWVKIINAIAALVSCVLAGIAAIYAAKARAIGSDNTKAIAEVHRLTNSMKDQLVKAAGDAGYIAGLAEKDKKDQVNPPEPMH